MLLSISRQRVNVFLTTTAISKERMSQLIVYFNNHSLVKAHISCHLATNHHTVGRLLEII